MATTGVVWNFGMAEIIGYRIAEAIVHMLTDVSTYVSFVCNIHRVRDNKVS